MLDFGYPEVVGTVGDFGHVDFAAMNKGATPIFFTEPVINEKASEEQGRVVCDDLERVRIQIAGDTLSAPVHPVDDYYKARFSLEYQRWKLTREARHVSGTPLEMWPQVTPARIKEFESVNVFSVDDLAVVSDGNIVRLQDGRMWRDKAIAWLRVASETASETKFAAENERLVQRIEALENGRRPESSSKSNRSEKMKASWVARKAKAAGA